MQSKWTELKRPIMALAPMEEVSDTVFRQLLCELGKPDVMFSEFVNVRHIFSHGTDSSIRRLEYTSAEKPLVLQLWGNDVELYYQAADLAVALGYDGVDINMGCPQPKIVKQAACSALIKDPSTAAQIVEATKAGAAGRISVSVKTRIGFDQVATEEWIGFLLSLDLDAITVHGRTSAQMSKAPADWSEIGRAVRLRDRMAKSTLIIGNGDVLSLEQARSYVKDYRVDGVMIGRGIFHDPWLFNPKRESLLIDKKVRLETLLRHVNLWQQTWEGKAHYPALKRFFKIYCQGFDDASNLREQLMSSRNPDELKDLLQPHL